VQAGGEVITDALWSYADPLPEATAVRDHVAFLGDGVEVKVEQPAGVVAAA